MTNQEVVRECAKYRRRALEAERRGEALDAELVLVRKERDIEEVRRKQAEVQLAGCATAALGWAKDKALPKKGDYGWSPAFDDVLKLREHVERLREIVLPIGDCGIAWEPCARSHTPDELRKMGAARKAHDAAYDYAHEAQAATSPAPEDKPCASR